MLAYLEIAEVREQGDSLRAALDDLLLRPRVALRPKAKQWRFLRQCFEKLLDPAAQGDVSGGEPDRRQALQYRFEVQSRLRRFYLERGLPLAYVFELMDRRRALRDGLIEETYPGVAGYVLLVSPARPEVAPYSKTREQAEYLIKLVHEAALAEFAVYRALPDVRMEALQPYFVTGGSAYLRVRNNAEMHGKRGRSIAVPEFNPSTMRTVAAKLVERTATSAMVRTQEYWYLRWWSVPKSRYDSIYQETNHQRYYLTLQDGRWLVDSNLYPQPRATTPRRAPRE